MVTNRDLEMPSERCIRSLSPSAEHSSFFRRTARRRFFDKTLPNKRAQKDKQTETDRQTLTSKLS
jgi:hypothetical protein